MTGPGMAETLEYTSRLIEQIADRRHEAFVVFVTEISERCVDSRRVAVHQRDIGALIGGGVGALIGHSVNGANGAAVGAVIGSVTGAGIAARSGTAYVAAPPAYYAPPQGYYAPSPTYYAPPPTYVVPAPVYYLPVVTYYRPAPIVYRAPRVVYLPRPVYRAALGQAPAWGYYRQRGEPIVVVRR